MKYDDASWHYGGNFPKELPPEAGATHIGMFVAWAMLNDLGGEETLSDYGDLIGALSDRKLTPGNWFIQVLDEKFVDRDLNEEGNRFATDYFGLPEPGPDPLYLLDYQKLFPAAETLYHVEDSWATYDTLAPVIDARFARWRRAKLPFWKRLFK